MDVPVCPEQPGGWTCVVFHDQNLSWKILAKRGSRQAHNLEARHFGRLTQENVRNFDITRCTNK